MGFRDCIDDSYTKHQNLPDLINVFFFFSPTLQVAANDSRHMSQYVDADQNCLLCYSCISNYCFPNMLLMSHVFAVVADATRCC